MRCPVTKFITHATSHICFLILLAAATFRLTESGVTITTTLDIHNPTFESLTKDEKIQSLLKETLRPANTLLTHVQLCIVFWILGIYSCNFFSFLRAQLESLQGSTNITTAYGLLMNEKFLYIKCFKLLHIFKIRKFDRNIFFSKYGIRNKFISQVLYKNK